MRWAGYLESQVVGKLMKRPGALSVAAVTDVFVGGVLYTRLAWVIGFASFVARVRAGAEVLASPRLATVLYKKYEENNAC